MEFGLPEKISALLREYFEKNKKVDRVKIYGSRAKGNYRDGSDIDFALFGELDSREIEKIKGELDELSTPYKFDVLNYAKIENPALAEHIDRMGKIFFAR